MANSHSNGKNFDGRQAVADMLKNMDKEGREKLLANLKQKNPELVNEIKQKIFVFEDLLNLDGLKIQALLKMVPVNKLKLALRTASEELTAKVLANMNTRAASLLKEELATQGPQPKSAVTRAQHEIAEIAFQIVSMSAI